MPFLFGDSFGHYPSTGLKWNTAGAGSQINLPAANARTNTGVLQITGDPHGPQKLLGASFTKLIGQVAVNIDSPGITQNPTVMQFQNAGSTDVSKYNIGVRLVGDGSVQIYRGAGDTAEVLLGTSTNRPMVWNTWNTFECQCLFDATNGSVVLKVNGVLCLNIVGVRTVGFVASAFSDRFQLFGNGGGMDFRADFAVLDWSSGPNNSFIEGLKVYVETPFANGNPTNWTPLAGSNFSEVNQIPPLNDASYNSSGNIGDVDQYQMQLTGVPAAAQLEALQHCMDAKVDSGARTIASVVGGTVGNAVALTTSYAISSFPQDSVPAFPTSFGPKVTA